MERFLALILLKKKCEGKKKRNQKKREGMTAIIGHKEYRHFATLAFAQTNSFAQCLIMSLDTSIINELTCLLKSVIPCIESVKCDNKDFDYKIDNTFIVFEAEVDFYNSSQARIKQFFKMFPNLESRVWFLFDSIEDIPYWFDSRLKIIHAEDLVFVFGRYCQDDACATLVSTPHTNICAKHAIAFPSLPKKSVVVPE